MTHIDIVFTGPDHPDRNGPTYEFIEVEDENRFSVSRGEWVERDDGFAALRLPDPQELLDVIDELEAILNTPLDLTQVLDNHSGRALWGAHLAGRARTAITEFKGARK